MAQVRWTDEAVAWLQSIYDYIAETDPQTAANVVDMLYRKAESLDQFPLRGHRYRIEPDGEIRILYHGRYRIAYLVKSEDAVEILGIFHAALQIEEYL